MRTVYLILAGVGFCVPAPFAWLYTIENPDNLLFITNPAKTVEHTFVNYASAAFTADLVWVFLVFCTWVLFDTRALDLRPPGVPLRCIGPVSLVSVLPGAQRVPRRPRHLTDGTDRVAA